MINDRSLRGAESRLAFAFRRWRLQRRFRRLNGYHGDFEDPKSYQEKMQFRKLYGAHQWYARVSDKVRVREYVAQVVGEKYLVPLLGVYDRLSPHVFESLPNEFIIKANHGSKWHKIVRDKRTLDVNSTVRYFNRLMKRTYGRKSGEFHYRLINPKILIEQLLLDEGQIPCDYVLFCYHGRNGFDYATTISLPKRVKSVHFDRDWNVWEGEFTDEEQKKLVNPPNFSEMVEVAKKLSEPFDFVRIDLYNVQGRIYFGEITCTPGAGLAPIENEFRAAKRREMWELDADNTQLYRRPKAA